MNLHPSIPGLVWFDRRTTDSRCKFVENTSGKGINDYRPNINIQLLKGLHHAKLGIKGLLSLTIANIGSLLAPMITVKGVRMSN